MVKSWHSSTSDKHPLKWKEPPCSKNSYNCPHSLGCEFSPGGKALWISFFHGDLYDIKITLLHSTTWSNCDDINLNLVALFTQLCVIWDTFSPHINNHELTFKRRVAPNIHSHYRSHGSVQFCCLFCSAISQNKPCIAFCVKFDDIFCSDSNLKEWKMLDLQPDC